LNRDLKKFFQYVGEYQWSNIFAMIRNGSRDPEICNESFKGKLVLITGATSGIGRLAAKKFASMGANLLCINRSRERSKALKQEIESSYGVSCHNLLGDLSKLDDIHRLAAELRDWETNIDILIFNAGVYLTRKETTEDGLEKVLAVHYLSYFILTHVLMEKLKAQESARIILVNSEGHRFAAWGLRLDDLNFERRRYAGLKSYGSAKLAQLLSMIIFKERFEGSGVTINAMHPGAVKTETGQDNGPLYRWYKQHILDRMLKDPELSAEALYFLGVAPELEGVSGKFFSFTTQEMPAPPALDREIALELWDRSLEMTGLVEDENTP